MCALQDYESGSNLGDVKTESQSVTEEQEEKQQNSTKGKTSQPVRFGWVTGVMVRMIYT